MFDILPSTDQKWIHSMISLQIPKTGSSSINSVLKDRNLIQKHINKFKERFLNTKLFRGVFDPRHALPEQIYQVLGNQVFEYFSFAVVREPAQRLISSFNFGKQNRLWRVYKLPEDITLDGYVDWLWKSRDDKNILILLPQSTWTHSSIFRPTEILKFESLNEDWLKMIDKHNIKDLPKVLPHENKSKKPENQSFSNQSLKIIQDLYEQDFLNHYPNANTPEKEETIKSNQGDILGHNPLPP